MTTLGIRYPKSHDLAQVSQPPSGAADFHAQRLINTPFYFAEVQATCWVAPVRYSEVRKVAFWVNVHLQGGATWPARLRIAAFSTSGTSIIPNPFTLAPSSSVRLIGTGEVFAIPGADIDHLFVKEGTTSTHNLVVSTNEVRGAMTTLVVEFDRFDADSADFFSYWDSQSGANDYLAFRPVIERRDGSLSISQVVSIGNLGMSIVQAPSVNNKTVTLVPMSIGQINGGAMPTTALGTAGFRGTLFNYIAANWDHITSVNMLTYAFWANANARDFNVGLMEVDTNEPISHSTLVSEGFSDNGVGRATGDCTLFRSADIKAFLVDGSEHDILFQNLNGPSLSYPVAWLEIIQEGYTMTECRHTGGLQFCWDLNTGGLYGAPACGLFDPLWYQSFPDTLIRSSRIYLAFRHDDVAADATIRLHLDANLESDVTGLSGTSATIAGITPSLNSTPTNTAGFKTRIAPPVPDPINLAGKRRLIFGVVIPTSGPNPDFAGTTVLIYALSVPNKETPELGDVFPVGAFNPEGCASTAAGLGDDPGLLIITNGSDLPKQFDPVHEVIENAGIEPPFCEEPLPTPTVDDNVSSPDGGLGLGIYKYRYTFLNCCTRAESDPNDKDIEVDTSGATPAAKVTLSFAGIRIPGDPQICSICVYRTELGGDFPVMAKVGCFDPSVTELFVDTLSDTALDFLNDPLSILNGAMPCVPIVAEFRNRLFGMGDIPLLSPKGTVTVANGSKIVEGDLDVEWDRCLKGKFFKKQGDCRAFEIDCVMPPASALAPAYGRLRLKEPYSGGDSTGSRFTICGRQNRVYYSEPVKPNSWPAANFIDVEPGDGDMLMGAVSNFDRLVICKRRKTYVLAFSETPAEVNVPVRISSDIGCIAPRSYAQIESGSVWLSDRGLAVYDGRSVNLVDECTQMNDLFTNPDNPNYVRRDELGRVIGAIGRFYPKRQQYLLWLPTKETVRGANLLLVWDTVLRNVTLHKFCQEFMSLEIAKDSDGNERVYAGDTNGFVWILDLGDSDGVGFPGSTGTVRGTISRSGVESSTGASFVDDDSASFLTGGLPGLAGLSGVAGLSAAFAGDDLGLAGVCLFFRPAGSAPDDPWDGRFVFAATEKRLYVTPALVPDLAGYEYMLGAIDFRAEFKPTNFGTDDMLKRPWRLVCVYEPESVTSKARVQLIPDFQSIDPMEGTVVDAAGDVGQGRVFDVSFTRGRLIQPVGREVYNYEQMVVTNFAPEEPLRLLNLELAVEPRTSK